MKYLLLALLALSCKKETNQTTWECTTDNYKMRIQSDTMPIIKTLNQYGNLVVCDCKIVK